MTGPWFTIVHNILVKKWRYFGTLSVSRIFCCGAIIFLLLHSTFKLILLLCILFFKFFAMPQFEWVHSLQFSQTKMLSTQYHDSLSASSCWYVTAVMHCKELEISDLNDYPCLKTFCKFVKSFCIIVKCLWDI